MTIRSVAPLIAVRDVPSSVAFYGKFRLAPVVEWSTYAKLSDGAGAVLHIAEVGDAPPDRPTVALAAPPAVADSVPAIVVIQVDDCRRFCAALREAGVDLLTEPAVPAWGGEVRAFVTDPDGHLIEINEPTDPVE
jgi:catechol 2,3-dioxygenase-like lactoylglutathione lyase family enzyme